MSAAPEGSAQERGSDHGLLRMLVHASYWLDDGLQAYMAEHAGVRLPRAQSMAMVYLTEGVDRPSDLATKLAVSKQAAQQLLQALQRKGLIEVVPDPDNGRQKRVLLTGYGRELRTLARTALATLEAELATRIGSAPLAALHDALAADWGATPSHLKAP